MGSRFRQLVVVMPIMFWLGCGGGSTTTPPPPAVVTISVSPTQTTVGAGQTQLFTAAIQGTSNHVVTWQVDGTTGGNSTVGTITNGGSYTAPQVIPNPATVTITAISQADTSKTATASATIAIGVSVLPSSVSIDLSGSTCTTTQQFTATVVGSSNLGVDWSVNGVAGGNGTVGTITSSGLYTSPVTTPNPSTVTVSAASQADSAQSATASVGFTPIMVFGGGGGTLNIGGLQLQFAAKVVGTCDESVAWAVNGIPLGNSTFGTITSGGLYTTPNAIPNPPTFNVTATSQVDPTKTGIDPVTLDAGGPGVNQAFQTPPIILGTSGGNALDHTTQFCCSGTLGSEVTRNGTKFILSNNHVLARSGHAVAGEDISQPGLVDTNCTTATHVADFSQAVTLNANGTSAADAALAQVVSGQVDSTGSILQIGPVVSGLAQPAPPASSTEIPTIGLFVAKSGRTSGLTCGAISSITTSVTVQYENSCGSTSTFLVSYNNQVVIDSTTFSAPGDSGSLIVDANTAEPVALLFAGDSSTTIANPIQAVLTALVDPNPPHAPPTFVGGANHTVSACTGTFNANAQQMAAAAVIQPRDEDFARAVTTKEKYVTTLMVNSAVIGVGVGAGDAPGEAAIVVFVDRDKPLPAIPATLDGVKTKVKSVGRFKSFGGPVCPANDPFSNPRGLSARQLKPCQ